MTLTCAIQKGIFLKQFLSDMLAGEVAPIFDYVDNKGTIELANNPVHHKRSKHIDIKFHFIREHIQNSHVAINYVLTNENVANTFTKPKSRMSLQKFNLVQINKLFYVFYYNAIGIYNYHVKYVAIIDILLCYGTSVSNVYCYTFILV